MIFKCSTDLNSAWLLLDGENFFPSTQANIRMLYSRWLYPENMAVAREIIEYLAERMDRIKARWMEQGIEIQEWPAQEDAREYRNLERNWVLLNTLYSGGSKHV